MKIAVLFHRLGPYHFARLRAAARLGPVVAIETSGTDETYAWDWVAGADGFERVTLFEKDDAQKLPARIVVARVAAALDKIQPQGVVIPGWSDAAALGALRWSLLNRIPAVLMSESTAWDTARSAWREALKRRVVGLASAALAGGTPHRDYLVQLGLPPERIFLGYDAVDNGYFAGEAAKWRKQKIENRNQPDEIERQTLHGPRKSEGKNQFQLAAFPISAFENGPFFLASARFVEKKNLPRLIQAYARYRELAQTTDDSSQMSDVRCQNVSVSAFAPWPLVLLGDGPLRSDLCRLISDLSLQDSVLLPGFKQYPELPAYYAHAGAFIHASTTEQWGLVVNEAMASGLPVLVSNRCGCAADLVQEGVNGFTFDPYNVEQLAQLMLKISAFNFPLSAFGSESRAIIANWGPDRFASGLKAAVDCALKVGPQRATLLERALLETLMRR